MRYLITFIIGVVMAMGFVLGGVNRPETIVGFLDFFGDWNPTVLLVLAAAVTVTFISFRLILRRKAPVFEPRFAVPTRRDIDGRLVVGAAVFGLGWGLTGLCPGPALAALPMATPHILVWFGALVLGMVLFQAVDRVLQSRAMQSKEREKKEGRGATVSARA